MNITASSLNCVQVGDGWSALETSGPNGMWTALAPATPRAGQTQVKMWLKGVTITGAVTTADANANAYPELPGPASLYRMGLIQIIKKLPVMVARYEGYKYRRWLQRTIPFFDSTGVDASPWYNLGTRADLAAGVNTQVKLEDYPTTIANVQYDGTLGSGRIQELQKALDFDVYLAVARKTTHYIQSGIRILWKLEWSTETHLSFAWNGGLRYTVSKFTRTATPAAAVTTAAASRDLVSHFPISGAGANEAISSTDLV